MIDEQKPDNRYAPWWGPFLIFLVAVLLLVVLFIQHRSELRDLQRRVGQVEQEAGR